MQLSQKFDTLEHVLKQSGLEVALGRNALFFKSDLAFDKKKGGGSLRSDTFEMSVNNVSFNDEVKVTQVDLENKNYQDIFFNKIFEDKGSKQNRVYVLGELSYTDAKDVLNHISEGNNQYNGIIMWELQMI